ncbi:MAG TPA: amino acid racemase [Terriglobales bacterium]|jgi:aspartate racemase|nr:amino acid racemase [Terriglobales bacterium]
MKTLGIVGGLGPESTIEYYRFILAACRERRPGASPAILINSLDVDYGISLLDANKLDELAGYLADAVEALARAGADFALIAANTPHIVFDPVQRGSPIPLISIVEATCGEAQRLGLTKLALLGTGFTMRGRFYPDVFARAGIELVVPGNEEQAFIHDKYIHELLKNIFLPATRDGLFAIVEKMKEREGIQGIILAGTELPLILREVQDRAGISFLDTTKIHVERAVLELLS